VCNKLPKQAFAIAKSGVEYDADYRSVLLMVSKKTNKIICFLAQFSVMSWFEF